MARTTPRVAGATLIVRADDARGIAVGTPAWYAWLEGATTFAFAGVGGSFTARKEWRRADGYWKAFRKRAGVVRSAYLGKSADLSLERLQAAAAALARSGANHGPSAIAASVAEASPLPNGTLTFFFTDIEGSTQLWEQQPQAMPAALARHDAILRLEIELHGGIIFKTAGDSVHAVFARAGDALLAAQAAQAALHAEPWDATGPLQVRMALHTGVAEQRDGDYFGATLNRIARILTLGHGGQILLSRATHDLVADDLPAHTMLYDLGEHHLKGLGRPEQIFELTRQNLPSAFPPLQSQEPRPVPSSADTTQLLATKLYMPLPRPHLVARTHLVERLRAGLMGKLTLISAPAGFGKTTLVSEWLNQIADRRLQIADLEQPNLQSTIYNLQSPRVAWVSLDASDNDPTRFWTYVITALETVYPQVGMSTMALLRSPEPPPMEAILTPLLNAVSAMSEEAALILDDYHLITIPAIHTAVAFLLDHLPAQLHLIMLTRADPPLPLTRLRMRGQLTELRAADLRFTAAEAATFLTEVMALPLSSDQVGALETRTEGWVAGLQLAALAMQNRSDHASFVSTFSGTNRFVVDYLIEEVMSRLPAHLQMFLTQTAILDRMCGPLCDAVLGVGGWELEVGVQPQSNPQPPTPNPQAAYSQLILDQLEQANLFVVPLDHERHWYRYHHLFADVLRIRLHSGAAVSAVAALHQRASRWYEQTGLIGEAVRYALLAHDSERAADLIERHAMVQILARSDVLLVQSWVEQLPRTLILARPQLALITGFILVYHGQPTAVEHLLADAAPALSAPDLAPNMRGELALLRSMIARIQDNAAVTLDYAQQALTQLALDNHGMRGTAAINIGVASIQRGELTAARTALAEAAELGELSGSMWVALGALEELASLHARAGELRQTLRASERATQLSARSGGQPIPAAGMGLVGCAEVLYEWNDLAGAMRAAAQGIELLRGTVERRLLARGYIVLAQVQQAQGDQDAALESIRRCEEWFAQTQIAAPGTRAWLAAHQARLWVRQGNLEAAARWVPDRLFTSDSEVASVQQLTLVRLRLAQSDNASGTLFLSQASTLLQQLLPTYEEQGWARYQIEGLMLQALVCQAQADTTTALNTLQRALMLAEPEGYIRLFVDAGAPMAALLAQLAGRTSPVASYAATLLEAFSERLEARSLRLADALPASSLKPLASTLIEPLSEREREVLLLIAAGHSNQEIADLLVVAVSTVKRHINNFYGKLGVQSRTQALVRARELNLL